MGSCTGRHFLLTVCVLQLVVVIECQVFDFMGFMYGPILANFFHIILIILGFFGTFQYSPKYILAYCLWNIFWIGWNIFVICFYLDAGSLDKNSDILNLGTGSRSWWEIHGYGCLPDFTTAIINGTSLEQDPDPSRPPKPTKVEGCLIEYQYVEVIQASIQCLLSVLGVMGGLYISKTYLEEDDSSKEGPQRPPLCSVDYNYQTSRRHLDLYHQQLGVNGYGPQAASPRPMTPRRVKRRSVLARDTMNRSSLTHRRQGSSRSRSSQRRARPSPVTRLLEQQNRYLDNTSTSFNDSTRLDSSNAVNDASTNQDLLTNIRYTKTGLSNPVFQQSSNSSLNQSGADEIYRPNSARSSYSNYHASRPISYLHNNEYFSNQAVAQVPINTNRSKNNVQTDETQNNLHPNLNTTTLKSFSHKNFNFLGFNLKNNNINNNNNESSLRGDVGVRNSKRFRVDLTRRSNSSNNTFFSQGPPAYREGGLDSETVI